jgi:hypothetical protein
MIGTRGPALRHLESRRGDSEIFVAIQAEVFQVDLQPFGVKEIELTSWYCTDRPDENGQSVIQETRRAGHHAGSANPAEAPMER